MSREGQQLGNNLEGPAGEHAVLMGHSVTNSYVVGLSDNRNSKINESNLT